MADGLLLFKFEPCTHVYTHSCKHMCPEAGMHLPDKFHDHIILQVSNNKINTMVKISHHVSATANS